MIAVACTVNMSILSIVDTLFHGSTYQALAMRIVCGPVKEDVDENIFVLS
jgi:hypothetical protein